MICFLKKINGLLTGKSLRSSLIKIFQKERDIFQLKMKMKTPFYLKIEISIMSYILIGIFVLGNSRSTFTIVFFPASEGNVAYCN